MNQDDMNIKRNVQISRNEIHKKVPAAKEHSYLLNVEKETKSAQKNQNRKSNRLFLRGKYADDIINLMKDALILIDESMKIKFMNQAASELLGYKKEELVGGPAAKIFIKDKLLFTEAALNKTLKKGSASNIEFKFLSKSGKKIPVILSYSIIKDEYNNLMGIICIANDIRKMKLLIQKLCIR